MKLIKVDFYLDWPLSIESKDLGKYIMNKLVKKGKIIRWSIIDIQDSIDQLEIKKLKIHAVLAD